MNLIKLLFFLFLSSSLMAQNQLDFVLLYGDNQIDTLKIRYNASEAQYACLWKNDTLLSEWSYNDISTIFSPMGAWGLSYSFLLAAHAGDGCPVIYYIMTLKDDGSWFVSEPFGNCEAFSSYQLKNYTQVEFTFPALAEARRKKIKVLFDSKLFELKLK